jgi:hypothetical protein
VPSLPFPCYTLSAFARKGNDSLTAEGQIGDKSRLLTTEEASVAINRPDITAGLPEREALVEQTLGWHPVTTWVFITKITNEFILGLRACPQEDHGGENVLP